MDLSLGCTRMLIDESKAQGLLRNQCAYVLATAFWETAHTMQPVVEAYWLSENWRRSNLRYYPWYGRGFVQLTWEKNYQRAEAETGQPVHQNPALALNPMVAAKIAVTGMREGWFTGRDLNDFIDLGHSDFVNARRIINGTDRAQEIAVLAQHYDDALKAEWVG
ncbi:carboxypeptidase [Mesorhizobium sp. NZP2077]|uniref:carboxypeptidase n=1 Tax=Mesorhizobium sp. NZP2077 TaxID=2483404 RepID=UPI0015549EF9|nr:carboxypeptidase [Mesorhizobium sp. NZP2077]QKC83287.1 carboxypeptidase [Mesorhizobium sp. NZP2077]QKD16804.1 carboxypeptidase [Mesorhizobium sp. NZP2077]